MTSLDFSTKVDCCTALNSDALLNKATSLTCSGWSDSVTIGTSDVSVHDMTIKAKPLYYNIIKKEDWCRVYYSEKDKEKTNMLLMVKLPFKITDYKVHKDKETGKEKVVIVTFEDGSTEKAVCMPGDSFDIERGVEICVLKHLLTRNKYNKITRTAMNQIKAVDKAKEKEKAEAEKIARKKAKADRHKAKRIERKRTERINDMKAAYVAAMKEYDAITANCDSKCTCDCSCDVEN